jgi:hypothetical protein
MIESAHRSAYELHQWRSSRLACASSVHATPLQQSFLRLAPADAVVWTTRTAS